MQGQILQSGRHPSQKDFGELGAAASCLLRDRLLDMIQSQRRAMYDVVASTERLCRYLARADSTQACLGCRLGLEPSRNRERFLQLKAVAVGAKVFLQRRYRMCAQFAADDLGSC